MKIIAIILIFIGTIPLALESSLGIGEVRENNDFPLKWGAICHIIAFVIIILL